MSYVSSSLGTCYACEPHLVPRNKRRPRCWAPELLPGWGGAALRAHEQKPAVQVFELQGAVGWPWGGTHGWVGYCGELWYHYPGEAAGAVVPGPPWHGGSEFTLHLPERTGFCWHASNGFKWGSHFFFLPQNCLSIFTIFYRPRSCLGCWAAGLLVPTGQNNVRVLNGSSHGKGIYTAKTQNTAPQLAAVHMHHHASMVYWYMNLHVQVYACSRVSSWWFQLL